MKHWVFDLDGTLVDSFSHYFSHLEMIFSRFGSNFSSCLQEECLTIPLTEFFAKHLGPLNVMPAMDILQQVSNADAARVLPFRGIQQGIEHLVASGSQVAVWTNRDLVSASLILKHSGLEKYLAACVSGTCVTQRKPHPEGLLRIVDQFRCAPGEVTMVGDHEHDVMAAKSVGVRAVRASWHSYWTMEACSHADHQFHQVDEFLNWMKKG